MSEIKTDVDIDTLHKLQNELKKLVKLDNSYGDLITIAGLDISFFTVDKNCAIVALTIFDYAELSKYASSLIAQLRDKIIKPIYFTTNKI